MDMRKESTSQPGNKEAMDILSAALPDDTSDEDSNRESVTYTGFEGHSLAARQSEEKHAEDVESVDETAIIALIELISAKLEQEIKMLRRKIKRQEDRKRKLEAEVSALRRRINWLWIQTKLLRKQRDLLWIRNELVMNLYIYVYPMQRGKHSLIQLSTAKFIGAITNKSFLKNLSSNSELDSLWN